MPALRMKSGVGWAGSPTQNGRKSVRPMPLLGFVLLAVVFRGRLARSWPKRSDLPRFVLCAAIGHMVHISAVMYGMNLSTAFSSSLVLTSQPLFTLMILAALGAERLRTRQIIGTLVGFAGIVLFR